MIRSAVVLLALIAVSVVHAGDDKPKPDRSQITAAEGTPKIDGEVDALWKDAKKIAVKKPIQSLLTMEKDEMATAVAQILWDEEHIYVLWRVKDTKLSAESSDSWQQDSVEVFVDENNQRTSFYEDDDAQYRVNFKGELSGQGQGYDESNLEAAARKTKRGYVIEMKIRTQLGKLEAGQKLGLELQVNDDPGTGSRGAAVKWHHAEDDSWEDTSHFGTLILK